MVFLSHVKVPLFKKTLFLCSISLPARAVTTAATTSRRSVVFPVPGGPLTAKIPGVSAFLRHSSLTANCWLNANGYREGHVPTGGCVGRSLSNAASNPSPVRTSVTCLFSRDTTSCSQRNLCQHFSFSSVLRAPPSHECKSCLSDHPVQHFWFFSFPFPSVLLLAEFVLVLSTERFTSWLFCEILTVAHLTRQIACCSIAS